MNLLPQIRSSKLPILILTTTRLNTAMSITDIFYNVSSVLSTMLNTVEQRSKDPCPQENLPNPLAR